MMKANMGGWHRAAYAAGGAIALGLGFAREAYQVLFLAVGVVLVVEAATGR